LHGFNSATQVWDISQDNDGRELIAFYVGDYDPSGMCMSESDLPKRLEKYGGNHVDLRRLALRREQLRGLPSFPASDKIKDTRYSWFTQNYGPTCWELDAMDPRDLRNLVAEAIRGEIESEAWERCEVVERAERQSLRHVLDAWKTGGANLT
jgi:hypothetical protein